MTARWRSAATNLADLVYFCLAGPTALLCLAAAIVVGIAACGNADRGAYMKANKRVFRQLPTYPGARLEHEVSSAARAKEDGPVVGYVTGFAFQVGGAVH